MPRTTRKKSAMKMNALLKRLATNFPRSVFVFKVCVAAAKIQGSAAQRSLAKTSEFAETFPADSQLKVNVSQKMSAVFFSYIFSIHYRFCTFAHKIFNCLTRGRR